MLANVKPVTPLLKGERKRGRRGVPKKGGGGGPTAETLLGRPSTSGGLVSVLKLPLLLVPAPALHCTSRTPPRFTRMVLSALSLPLLGVYVALQALPSVPITVRALSVPLLVSY